MFGSFQQHLQRQLADISAAGTCKRERVLTTPQGARVRVADGQPVLNLCANNYLGLAQHPAVTAAAREALEQWGYGLASVRFICGTQSIHQQLEAKLAEFLGTEDTILYSSCFDANGGLFETLLGAEDAVISDELNHASIIDGIRLCKAQRFRYRNNDMGDLEAKLRETASARFRLIATDGVFSMDGSIANLPAICDLAEKHGALVMVDDSHAVGVLGRHGRGSLEHHGVMGRVDIITGTLGKALGGARIASLSRASGSRGASQPGVATAISPIARIPSESAKPGRDARSATRRRRRRTPGPSAPAARAATASSALTGAPAGRARRSRGQPGSSRTRTRMRRRERNP